MAEDDALRILLADEYGTALLKEATRSVVTWDGLMERPLPSGSSARQTWEALQRTRMAMGVDLPFTHGASGRAWYGMTLDLANATSRIERECHEDSSLWRMFEKSSDQHFLMHMRVSDALASAELDGLAIRTEEASSLLRYDQTPRTPAERVIKNAFGAFDRLREFEGEPFSVSMMKQLRDLVLEDVDEKTLEVRPRNLGLIPFDPGVQNDCDSVEILSEICRYANHEAGDPYDPPALRCMFLVDIMYGFHPLGKVSGQVGKLVSYLYARRHGIPLLGVLPLLQARVEWTDGAIKPPQVSFDRTALEHMAANTFASHGSDSTLHHTTIAQLACIKLDELKIRINAWNRQDEAMREALKREAPFNYRQRAVLARALRRPDATFSIKYHQTNHAVSYATARRDLTELEEKGYLVMALDGHTMVFRPASNLEDLLGVTVVK